MPLKATSTSGNAKTMSSSDGVPRDRRRIGQHLGLEQQRQAEREQQQLQHEVAEHEHRRALVAARPAAADRREGDVEHDRAGDQELADALVEAVPEQPEVVRRGERAERDQDQVVQADRPAGDERHQLVEGVAGDHGRAAALLVQRGALDVAGHDHREQHRAGQEDGPRQPERALGHQPGREVDRRGDEALDDPEQRRAAEPVLEHHRRFLSHSRPAPVAMNRTPEDQPEGGPVDALDERAHDQRDADDHHQDREQQGADHQTTAARSSALRCAFCGAGADSMITRQGRSASTVSSVLPNSEAPLTRCGQRHHDRRRAHVGRLLDDPPPGLAGAHALDVPGHARADLHAGLLDDRLRRGLLLRHPRVDRQRARDGHQREDMDAAASPRGELGRGGDDRLVVVLGAHRHQHGVVLGLVIDHGLRDRDLVRRGQVQPLLAAVDEVDDHAERQPADAEGGDGRGCRTTITTNATAVKKPAATANSGHVDARARSRSPAPL